MTSFTFVIPLNREDLLVNDNPSQYFVQELVSAAQIPRKLADCNAALSEDGFLFILSYFDPIFSALHQSRDIDTKYIILAHSIILKGLSGMCRSLLNLMEGMDSHLREKLLNAAKMFMFLLFESLRSLEERFNSKTDKELAVDAKSRKKAIKNFVDFDWDEKRNVSLVKLHEFIQLPLSKLWEPPVADEDFVNLAANCCYKTLEDPQVTQSRLSYLKHTLFDILGTLIQKYGHGLSCTVKMVQLMKIYEHLPEALAQAAVKFVREYQSRNFVREVIREIHQSETAFENSTPKACSHFLIEIAKLDSEIILPSMSVLLPELESDSYMMRNCVLGVLGEVVHGSLSKEHLSEEQKETRDIFLEHLEEHLIDTNATVRSKVLKVWQRLCEEKAIPVARLSQLLESVVRRLEDVSWSVTRSAVQLYHSLLQSNPFDHKLEIEKLKEKLSQEEDLLAVLEKECNSRIPLSRSKQWDEIASKVVVVLEEALSVKEAEEDLPEEAKGKELPDNIMLISRYLESEKYLEAFYVLRHTEKQSDASKQRSNQKLEWQVDYFHNLLRKIYVQYDETAEDGRRKKDEPELSPEQREIKEKLMKQRTFTQYLKDCIVFAEQLEKATGIINKLLFSAQPAVILDALEFLTAAYQFGLKGALAGVQNMLLLVWSSETSVKNGVAVAYKQLYIDIASNAPGRSRAGEIVRNLCHLLKTLDEDQQCALELLVREWVLNGDMDKDCIQIMWERFSLKLPDTSEEDSRSALILLSMVGGASPSILKTNIPVLVSVGLGERGSKDYKLAKDTCRALLKLVSEPQSVASNDEPFRLPSDHEIFQTLSSLLIKGYTSFDDDNYVHMSYEAIEVIYQLSEHPDVTCSALLNEFVELTKKASADSGEAFDELLSTNNESASQSKTANSSTKVSQEMLERLVFFIGHIAFRQWVHLDKAVFRELKRRNRIREIEAEKKRDNQRSKTNKDKRKSQANLNSSILSRASETPRLKKDKEDSADAELGEINADDAEADYINQVCESEIVDGQTILSALSPIVVFVCTNPQKFTYNQLQSTASLSLTKLMLVSSKFCEKNLPLVFTMMEKSSDQQIRSNLVYAIGDLANRFPNLIEPWTKHLYVRLQDNSSQVRLDTIVVLKHLITNEMVKVRGQISDMALCIVDAEERIKVMASEVFQDLSKKGNTLYNVMPDIISRLSNTAMNVDEEHFHVIMEFLLPLISKDRQMESLVDKLCQRFRASTTERQWSDIAFCLSLLQYSERSLRRLNENFQCYYDKLNTEKVYEAFESIIAQAIKTNKPERKVLAEELQAKIDEALKRGVVGEGGERGVADTEDSHVDVNDSNLNENIQHKRKDNKKRQSKGGRRRGRRKAYASSEDEDEEEEASEDEDKDTSDQNTAVPQSKSRKRKR